MAEITFKVFVFTFFYVAKSTFVVAEITLK